MDTLPLNHFLSLPRPPIFIGPPAGVPDTTTVAAHDFDVDTRTGFMPLEPPIERLPDAWAPWEDVLADAIQSRLQLGDKPDLTPAEALESKRWRDTVRNMPELSVAGLKSSEVLLRRTHKVLAWIMHFYVHSLPPTEPIRIPPPVTLPLLQVSAELQLPPVLTYSDDVLYNWRLAKPSTPDAEKDEEQNEYNQRQEKDIPTVENIRCQTTFTSTPDEDEFYLSSARLELAGVAALDLMRSTMDEAWIGDDISIRRITEHLLELAIVITRLRQLLLDVKKGCHPDVFYHQIRPWFRGADSQNGRPWIFEGIEKDKSLSVPVELSGASAGQSSLIHALDIFLGVEKYSHGKDITGHASTGPGQVSATPSSHSPQPSLSPSSHAHPQSHTESIDNTSTTQSSSPKSAFLKRMQLYMPRHHRAFLTHLSNNPRPLRDLVFNSSRSQQCETDQAAGQALLEAYNKAVMSLKEFRDAHILIVALYIVGPARRMDASKAPTPLGNSNGQKVQSHSECPEGKGAVPLKGTGGTDLVKFLKDVRDQTQNAVFTSGIRSI